MSKKVEILAPAGSYESLKAAIHAGCDAIYIGGSRFGARAFADNLKEKDLLRAIDEVHIHQKKIYLTVNTLLKEKELEKELYDYLLPFYLQGLDAVIVQDIGVISFIHRHFPEMPIHASTQMTLTAADGIQALEELGVSRVVTARELNINEIKTIRKQTSLEIESFVHGAICYCYSGQCFMSSLLGDRSGNRGRCAQPCRMPYKMKKGMSSQGNYLLSPKDMCTLNILPELMECGIDSFKIEGRMKRPEYTALTVATYRKYIDLYNRLGKDMYIEYQETHKKEWNQDWQNLMELYNRGGCSSGYYGQHNGKNMMSMNRPNHSGIKVGSVVNVTKNQAEILLEQNINSYDVLEFRNEREENLYDYTVKNPASCGTKVWSNYKQGSIIRKGNLVYRTKNQMLLTALEEAYLKKEQKIPIQGMFYAEIGKEMSLSLWLGEYKVTVKGDIVLEAKNQPIKAEKIKSQLEKTNTTFFEFEELELKLGNQLFIAVGQLNELRREGIRSLERKIIGGYQRIKENSLQILANNPKDEKENINLSNHPKDKKNDMDIVVLISAREQLEEVLSYPEIDKIYINMAGFSWNILQKMIESIGRKKKKAYLVLPSIFRVDTKEKFSQKIHMGEDIFLSPALTGVILKNYEEFIFIKEWKQKNNSKLELILDYNMHMVNREGKLYWKTKGIHHFTASIELNYEEWKELGCEDSEIVVYGHLPLMTSAQCLLQNTTGCKKASEIIEIKDRYKKSFYVKNICEYCYNILYNGHPLWLLEESEQIKGLHPLGIRLEFMMENVTETSEILKTFIEKFRYNRIKNIEMKEYAKQKKEITKGHFKRGME